MDIHKIHNLFGAFFLRLGRTNNVRDWRRFNVSRFYDDIEPL